MAMGSPNEHHVTLNLSFVQAVETLDKPLPFYETVRDGKRKRVYESVKPKHHFHIQYNLLPGEKAQVYKTDAVDFGIVSKIFTEQDERVVKTWSEASYTYYGWRHRHKIKVTRESLLILHSHTVEVKIWNSLDKLSARARYDRPKAFRLPVQKGKGNDQPSEEGEGLTSLSERPEKLPVIYQDKNINSRRRRRKGSNYKASETDSSDVPIESIECLSPVPMTTVQTTTIAKQPAGIPQSQVLSTSDQTPSVNLKLLDHSHSVQITLSPTATTAVATTQARDQSTSASSALKGVSRWKMKQLEAEAAEKTRIEREGLVALSLNIADLFATRTSVSAKFGGAVGDLRGVEVAINLETPLMSDALMHELNPMTVTIGQLTNLPSPLIQSEMMEQTKEHVCVQYQFLDKPSTKTPTHPLTKRIAWGHSSVIFLGTIPSELLLEYLRGPPLVLGLHVLQHNEEDATKMNDTIFGTLFTDQLLGTCTFGRAYLQQQSQEECQLPQAIALLDLTSLLDGPRVQEHSLPITDNPAWSAHFSNSPSGYLDHDCKLTVTVEVACSLQYPSIPATGHIPPSLRPKTPFGRLVYITTSGSKLVGSIVNMVNGINAKELDLRDLPQDTLLATLSTYKLTSEQMESNECDLITGFHIEDRERHVLVLEGLHRMGIRKLWNSLPHHPTQDESILKVFYNSDYTFSRRLYGNLDVDLTHIFLAHPLKDIVQQPALYIRGSLPRLCFTALMCLSELQYANELGELERRSMFPSVKTITALSLYCSQLPTPTRKHERVLASKSPDTASNGAEMQNRRRRRNTWESLDQCNEQFIKVLVKRKAMPHTDFIMQNIVRSRMQPEKAKRGSQRRHVRSLSENIEPVHLYSIQTCNSVVLGRKQMREKLDPQSRYTYCQKLHHMTMEPADSEQELKSFWKREDPEKWRTKEGFVYPGVKTSLQSNSHLNKSDTSKLTEDFVDGELHTNVLKPTIEWKNFPWDERDQDFERYKRPPKAFSTAPVTIHLAGESRAKELHESTMKDAEAWQAKLVVANSQFQVLRRGIRTELSDKGLHASSQTDQLSGLLKDKPVKKGLLPSNQLRVDTIPALRVISSCSQEEEHSQVVGFLPGPSSHSLKLDSNVIPLLRPASLPSHQLHPCDFNSYS